MIILTLIQFYFEGRIISPLSFNTIWLFFGSLEITVIDLI